MINPPVSPPDHEMALSKLVSNPTLMALLGALFGQYKMDGHPVKGGVAGLTTSLFWNLIKKKEENRENVQSQLQSNPYPYRQGPISRNPYMGDRIFPR
jgi:hypothetical protein